MFKVRSPAVIPMCRSLSMTGHDTSESRARAIRMGAKVYLRKPIDDDALLAAVGDAIDGVSLGTS